MTQARRTIDRQTGRQTAALKAHVERLDQERRELGPEYQDHRRAVLLGGGQARVPTRSHGGSSSSPRPQACPRSTCTTSGTATPPRARTRRSTGSAEQACRARGRSVHHEAVRSDRLGGRPPSRQYARRANHRWLARPIGGQNHRGCRGVSRRSRAQIRSHEASKRPDPYSDPASGLGSGGGI
jgi:hypothetical protein